MLRSISFKILTSFLSLLAITVVAFLLTSLTPRSPEVYRLGYDASPEAIADLRSQLGLNKPIHQQYVSWFSGVVRGDFGQSYVSGLPVFDELMVRLPRTLSLIAMATLFAAFLGFTLGIYAANSQGGWIDRSLAGVMAVAQAIPGFWLGILLVTGFSLMLTWFPATGYVELGQSWRGWLHSIILPAIALGMSSAAAIARQLRVALIQELSKDYVRCAIATGASRMEALFHYALRNAMGPAITILGYQVVVQLSSSIVVEKIFAIDGLGTMSLNAVFTGDTPTLLVTILAFAVLVLAINLLVDLGYKWVNPRVGSI